VATTAFVAAAVLAGGGSSGGASVLVSDTAPTGATVNSLWFESDTGILYIYYADGTSTQWVAIAAGGIDAGAVRFDGPQSLTSETAPFGTTVTQRAQARKNIYAAPFDAMAYSGMQINGGFDISQELTSRTSSGYVCDGWVISAPGGWSYTAGTGTDPTASGITKIVFVVITVAQPSLAAGEILTLNQPLEGYRIARLAWGTANAQPITVGFWTRHNRPGVYSLAVRNSAANRSYATTYNHAVSNVAQYNVVTIPGDTAGTWLVDYNTGIQLTFAMAAAVGGTFTAPSANTWLAGNYVAAPGQVNGVAATTDAFRITGVVVLPGIEPPSAARSALIMRPYDQELLSCKRYLHRINFAVAEYIANLQAFSPTQTTGRLFNFPVELRGTPLATASGTAQFSIQAPAGNFVSNGLSTAVSTVGTWATNISVPTGLTAGQSVVLFANTAAWLQYDARL
jgi:hypothetical protein